VGFTAVCHCEYEWPVVVMDEVFVNKIIAIDRFSTGSILIRDISSLYYETGYYSMEYIPFIM
jgi:hypothetical protein